jgi:hypothetical protein
LPARWRPIAQPLISILLFPPSKKHASFARHLAHRLEEATPALLKRNAQCLERALQGSFDL